MQQSEERRETEGFVLRIWKKVPQCLMKREEKTGGNRRDWNNLSIVKPLPQISYSVSCACTVNFS